MTTEQKIKKQFSKIFKSNDAIPFKQMADYYFRIAATIKRKDINAPNGHKLWLRNVQKRLYIGIATELILKALYLKRGFNINKSKRSNNIKFPETIEKLNPNDLNPADTYSLGQLINNLKNVIGRPTDLDRIIEGLNICKVFRNKEGHIAIHWHKFDREDFTKIEYSIKWIYEIGFSENLKFEISMTKEQGIGKFEIVKSTHQKKV